MTLRVLHVLDHSIPLHSGYTFRTLALLNEQRRMGWETFHLTSPKQGATPLAMESVDGFDFFRTPPPPAPALRLPGMGEHRLMQATEARLTEVARQVRPQLLHAHSPVLNALPALRVGRRLGIPVVYEVRAFWEDAAVDHGTTTEGSLRYRLTRALESYALRKVDHVFTICEGLRKDMLARGIASSKVTVIPNAVNVESFSPSAEPDATLRQELGLVGCEVLGFIGSFYAYEGLELLLDALPRILAVRPQVRVLLVGGGPQEAALKAQARRLGLESHVLFTGRVPHQEVARYYDQVDVLVYPRLAMRLTETVTPLKPLEAMAQGRVLIASDVGGHRELIEHQRTGMLFKAGDVAALAQAALNLLADRAGWPQLRAAGRDFVEMQRNWGRSASGYKRPYAALLGQGA